MKYSLIIGIIPLLVLSMLFNGCASQPSPDNTEQQSRESGGEHSPVPEDSGRQSSENEETDSAADSLMKRIDALYALLDRERLQVVEDNGYLLKTDAASLAELPAQLFFQTTEAYEYTQIIRNYLTLEGQLPEFDDASRIVYRPDALKIALHHTPPIKLRWEYSMGKEFVYHGPFTDNVIDMLVKQEVEQGRMPCDVYYAEDVEDTMRVLFGDDIDVRHTDIYPYYYYAKEHAYIRVSDFGGPAWQYPVITAMNPTPDGMICEAVIVWALDKDTPLMTGDMRDLTAENFETETTNYEKYRYTFGMEKDGRIILKSLKKIFE